MNTEFIYKSIQEFFRLKIPKLSASLAFFTFFSFPSLMVLLIAVGGYVYGEKAVEGKLFWQIKSWVGSDAAMNIQKIISGIHLSGENNFSTWFAAFLLLLTSAGIFAEIKDSINSIWELKPQKITTWGKWIVNRAMSFILILITGIVLLFSLSVNYIFSAFGNSIDSFMPRGTKFIIEFSNYLTTFLLLLGVATFIFKFLPIPKIKWRDAFDGALVSSGLFVIGKFVLSLYMNLNPVLTAYTATSSLILLLIWVYYSSIILYYGAVVTRMFSGMKRTPTPRKTKKPTSNTKTTKQI